MAGTWFHDAVPMSQLHFHLKESAMKPEPATYNVTGDPGLPSVPRARVYLCKRCVALTQRWHVVCREKSSGNEMLSRA